MASIIRRSLESQIWGAGVLPCGGVFSVGTDGACYNIQNLSTLFQDIAGTIPVTAIGDLVGRVNDQSSNGKNAIQATAGSRPTLKQTLNGIWYLDYGSTKSLYITNLTVGKNYMIHHAHIYGKSNAEYYHYAAVNYTLPVNFTVGLIIVEGGFDEVYL